MRVIKYTLTLAVLFVIGTICATALQQTPSRGVLVNKRGETRIIEYKNIDGLAVVEGDIVLGSADKLKSAYQSFKDSGDSKHALMILGPQYRWPNCSIPFTIDGSIRDREAEIRSVINVWNNLLRPRLGFDVWVARSSQVNYVTFTNSTSGICLSNIGMIGGQQFIRLSSGCDVGRIEHEMGHAMGLFHEQSRYDRDRYVHINYNNIRPEDRFNFDQHISDAEVVGMYDFGSIMHYGAYDFAIDPSIPTIEAPEPIGQRNAPSVWDMLGAWKNFTRGGWNVRICDGTHAQAIKFWVGSVRDNTTSRLLKN